MITVVCKYGSGDTAAPPYSHVLIQTRADAVQKGFRILNGTWAISNKYKTKDFPYPVGGHLVRPGVWITVSFPEANIWNVPSWVYHVTKAIKENGVRMTLGFETYEKGEA